MKQFILAVVTIQCCITVNLTSSFLDGEVLQLLYVTPSASTPCPANPCLTLYQFSQNSSNWLSSDTTLIFLAGNHVLSTDLSISNILNFFMLTDSIPGGAHTITCQHQVSFNFENMTELWMKKLNFVGCGGNTFSSIKNFIVENSTFQGQNNISSTALDITQTNLTIVNSSFFLNNAGRCLDIFDINTASNISLHVGGVIFVDKSNISIINCTFINNSAEFGGVIYSTHYEFNNNISISNSTFVSNRATTSSPYIQHCNWPNNPNKTKSTAGVIAIFQSKLIIRYCTFINNTSETGEGGVLSIQQESSTSIYKSEFHGNSAKSYGGAFIMREVDITIDSSVFHSNSANQGGVMYAMQITTLLLRRSIFRNNTAEISGGVVSMDQTSMLYDHHGRFHYNRARDGGALYAIRSGIALNNSVLSHNQAKDRGGAIYVLQSQPNVTMLGQCNLIHNYAGTGGAICAVESTIVSIGSIWLNFTRLTIAFNRANYIGGGIYLDRSVLNSIMDSITNISCNSASSSGGGVYATNSLVVCTEYYRQVNIWPYQTLMFFTENSALKGGGLFVESAAQLRIQKVSDITNLVDAKLNTSIYFTSNRAQYGAAVYVADETYFDVCGNWYNEINGTATSNAECFIQVFSEARVSAKESSVANIEFETDDFSTSLIYGGLLDRCIPDPRRAEIYTSRYIQKKVDGFTYMKLISNINDTEYLGSLPVRVCFCIPDYQPDCSYEPPIIHVKKGGSFNVSLVAVDQVNHTLKNVEVYSSLNHAESSLGEGQSIQVTEDACTNLTFGIYSPHHSEQLILYADGPCRNASKSQRRVHIAFQTCTCPIGFEPKNVNNDCICVCDSRLSPYFTEADNNCNVQTQSLTRHGNIWIGFFNDTGKDHNCSGFLIYPYCPLDYCLPPTSNVHINFNILNGCDAQCANNRSGLLCSLCQPGLSLSLGSSRCMSCSDSWQINFAMTLLAAILAGVLLVTVILILNLTVAVGTLNGLVFFANIIESSSATFFPTSSVSVFYVLVKWLNLEIGLDVCFFEGMTIYWKTCLQLAFPLYILALVVLIMIVSRHSKRFSDMIGNRNPVATLATLILLCYAKLLRVIITALSMVTLHYPDGSHEIKWLPDATVDYFDVKHTIMFLTAIFILLIGIAFTLLLFLWQWIVRWVKSTKLHNFVEPYIAPYSSKHRYWTGLLLLARVVIYLTISLNGTGDPSINLLVIIVITSGLLFLKGHFGLIYRDWKVDGIEMVCYLNALLFSAVKMFTLDSQMNRNDSVAAFISGSVMLLTFLCILVYHIIHFSVCLNHCITKIRQKMDINHFNAPADGRLRELPTTTVIEGLPHRDNPLPNIHRDCDENLRNISGQLFQSVDDDRSRDNTTAHSDDVKTPLLNNTRSTSKYTY